MELKIDSKSGFHVVCDRCGEPAMAAGKKHIWVEYSGSSEDEPAVVCAKCDAKTGGARTGELDTTLGEVLLGALLNSGEPFAESLGFLTLQAEIGGNEGSRELAARRVAEMVTVLRNQGIEVET